MKKNVVIKEDFGLLDKGAEETNPFVLITGLKVDDNGEAIDPLLGARVMSNEAVRKGAVRINESDCVDIDNALEAYNDKLLVFNGGDIYAPYDGEWARQIVIDYPPDLRERALEYINHRENRYAFLVAQGMFVETDEHAPISFLDEVKDFIQDLV